MDHGSHRRGGYDSGNGDDQHGSPASGTRSPAQAFEISQASPYTEYERGGGRNQDNFNNLRSEHFVPTYSNHTSPRAGAADGGRPGAQRKTPKYGVCCCLACGPLMVGAAMFLSVTMVAAYFYSEFALGGVFTNQTAQAALAPIDPVDAAIAADAMTAFIIFAVGAGLAFMLLLAVALTSCCQTTAPVTDDARRCACISAFVAALALLCDLGLCGLSAYCVMLIFQVDGVPLPAEPGDYGWAAGFGQAYMYGSLACFALHLACMITVGQHARKVQHEYNAHSYLTHVATEGRTARTD